MSLARWFKRRNKKRIEAAAKRQRKVLLEPLEPRILLSSDLSYTAAAGAAMDLTLRLQDDTLQLIDNNNTSGTEVVASQALADTSKVEITGGIGTISSRLTLTLTPSLTRFQLVSMVALDTTRSSALLPTTCGISRAIMPAQWPLLISTTLRT